MTTDQIAIRHTKYNYLKCFRNPVEIQIRYVFLTGYCSTMLNIAAQSEVGSCLCLGKTYNAKSKTPGIDIFKEDFAVREKRIDTLTFEYKKVNVGSPNNAYLWISWAVTR